MLLKLDYTRKSDDTTLFPSAELSFIQNLKLFRSVELKVE